jgi:Protein of unknown function (DUF5818)
MGGGITMRRIFLLSSILLLSAVWAVAQYDSGSTSESKAPASESKAPASESTAPASNMTIEGCLGGAVGNFTLTDQTGTTYQLTGNTEKMSDHVGHTVRVTGVSSSGAKDPGSMSEAAGAQPATLSVTSFKHVSASCKPTQ